MSEINVVPMIDVMLVLLVIFMATAPLLTQGVKVELPKAGAEPLPMRTQKEPPLILSIDSEGRRFLNTGGRTDDALEDGQLQQSVRAALAADANRDVLIRADTRVPYGRVVGAMVILQAAGASKLGFLTDPLPQAAARTP
ncbi:MAG: protein TolR [Steroidobacteraceae bacterium]